MNTHDWDARLNDYIDGIMDPGEAAAFEAELANDPALREDERRLRALLSVAKALPRDVAPERDLWRDIAPRLRDRQPARPHTEPAPALRPQPRLWWRWAAPALAAAFAGVFIAGVVARDVYWPNPSTVAETDPVATLPPGLEAQFAQLDADYAEAREALLAALRASDLPEETVETFRVNLDVIDAAIAETRVALQANPENGQLVRSLVASYDRKRALLQDALLWPGADTETNE